MVLIPMQCFGFNRINAMIWFQLDGKPVQIAIYNRQMLKRLEGKRNVVGKPPASTTKIIKLKSASL